MSYTLEAWVDGACRRNGFPDAVAGAGVFFPRFKATVAVYTALPRSPQPTNQRAELSAMILALEVAIRKQRRICESKTYPPFFFLIVHNDSQYAVKCLNTWIDSWLANGWFTSNGQRVQNRDLIEKAHGLKTDIERSFGGGRVTFEWVPREENITADTYANRGCDEAQRNLLSGS
ncbi:ribonuclease H-like domain-containing protein [Mycena epipterygia]|nr:ribonuclease H-like domain-containing protein [Mycena epipterygia]